MTPLTNSESIYLAKRASGVAVMDGAMERAICAKLGVKSFGAAVAIWRHECVPHENDATGFLLPGSVETLSENLNA